MSYKIKNLFLDKIQRKIKDGTFTKGNDCSLTKYFFDVTSINDLPLSQRTPEVCTSLMVYNKCRFFDVPESSRTREFFISNFTDEDVYNYIKNNIENFDRQFFKDLLASNKYATMFERNCFAIMPLDYIDEEMCSLAIVESLNWSDDEWIYSVNERKPEALSADLWCLGARLYASMSGKENKFLNITPKEFRSIEYYKEMCSCNYNCGVSLETAKGKIMDSIPQDILTVEFLLDLINSDIDSIARFSEQALETKFTYTKDNEVVCEKIWQFVVSLKGETIRNIDLNDERVEFFLNHYPKYSGEYKWAFKDKYKRYLKLKNDTQAFEQAQQRAQANTEVAVTKVLYNAYAYSLEGENPTKAISDETNNKKFMGYSLLPIKYDGTIPIELWAIYDSEEYLEMMYKSLGIQIIQEYDDLFYRVNLPYGWTIDNNGYWNDVKDHHGNIIIQYFYDSKFYDREAFVKTINIPKEKNSDNNQRILKPVGK